MRRAGVKVALVAVTLVAALSACTSGTDGSEPDGSGHGEPAPARTSAPSGASADASGGTPIRITIGEQTISATVWDNPTGAALLDQLPLTLEFEDLNGEEKIGHLSDELTMDGMPAGDDPRPGDLGYYAPWGNVVLYYGDVGRYDGIARIGRLDGDVSAIADQENDFTARIERAK